MRYLNNTRTNRSQNEWCNKSPPPPKKKIEILNDFKQRKFWCSQTSSFQPKLILGSATLNHSNMASHKWWQQKQKLATSYVGHQYSMFILEIEADNTVLNITKPIINAFNDSFLKFGWYFQLQTVIRMSFSYQ